MFTLEFRYFRWKRIWPKICERTVTLSPVVLRIGPPPSLRRWPALVRPTLRVEGFWQTLPLQRGNMPVSAPDVFGRERFKFCRHLRCDPSCAQFSPAETMCTLPTNFTGDGSIENSFCLGW